MTAVNPLKRAWERGRTTFGVWSMMPDAFGVELVAGAGYDYVCVDGQHGLADFAAMVSIFQSVGASGAAPLARVLANDPGAIGRVLDAGALGVIVPLVNNAEETARAVSAGGCALLRSGPGCGGDRFKSPGGSRRGGAVLRHG